MKYTIALLLSLFGIRATCQPVQTIAGEIEFAETSNILDKWGFMEPFIGHKRIVALGENLHGVKEYNAIKLELIQYLHEYLGFNVLAIESDLALNYFGGIHRADIIDTLFLKELFTPVWHTSEYLALVAYLKTHPDLKIIGFDILSKEPVHKVAERLNIQLDSASLEFHHFWDKYAVWDEINGDKMTTTGKRDSTMASVLAWIIDDLYPNEKVIVSAHNNHIANMETRKACMGKLLKDQYGGEYYSMGFFHSLGKPRHVYRNTAYENLVSELPENSLQYHFLQLKKDRLFLDMQSQRQAGQNKWLDSMLENVLLVGKYHYKQNLAQSFDGLIWVKEVGPPSYVIRNTYLERH